MVQGIGLYGRGPEHHRGPKVDMSAEGTVARPASIRSRRLAVRGGPGMSEHYDPVAGPANACSAHSQTQMSGVPLSPFLYRGVDDAAGAVMQ